jgi:hypothetical protein
MHMAFILRTIIIYIRYIIVKLEKKVKKNTPAEN